MASVAVRRKGVVGDAVAKRASAIMRIIAGAAIIAAAPNTGLQGQQTDSSNSGALSVGLSASATTPRGAFGQTTNTGFGIGSNMLVRLVPSARLNLRTDFAYHSYGNVSRPLSATRPIRGVDVTNSIATLLVGPQLFAPTGRLSPYASALGGVSYFTTSSTYQNTIDLARNQGITYSSDVVFAYGGAAGAYVRLGTGARAVRLDVGARYLRHDDVSYVTGDEVREALDEQRSFQPLRSRADYITFYVGAQVIVW